MTTWMGNTAENTNGAWPPHYVWGHVYSAPASGNVTAARGKYGGPPNADGKVKILLYAESGGAPAGLLGSSDELTIPQSSAVALRNFTFTTPVAVVSATNYFLVTFFGPTGAGNLVIRYDNTSGTLNYRDTSGGYPTPPNPFGTPTTFASYQPYLEAGIDDAAAAFLPRIISVT